MPAPEGNNNNPNIIEAGKATQFGSAGRPDTASCASEGAKLKNKIRPALRRLAAFEPGQARPTVDDLAKAFGTHKNSTNLTMAEIWALQKAMQASANWKAMDSLIDAVDGKQVDKKVSASVPLADILNGKADDQQIESNEE